MLLDHLMEHCAEHKFAVFDLGEGDSPHVRTWETHRLPLLSYEQGLTAAGLLYGQRRHAQWQAAHRRSHDRPPPRVVLQDDAIAAERRDH
jgi:hypothetical protein